MSTSRPVKTVLWRIAAPRHADFLPSGFVTAAPTLPADQVPMEVGLLLPTGADHGGTLPALAATPAGMPGQGFGLFMANPFLAIDREAERLKSAGIQWVANLPSTHQQDAEFRQQLEDVHLDWTREVESLARFGALGLKRLAVLSDETVCKAVLAAAPEAVAILPRVADFAAGFPSMLRRGGPAQAIAETLRAEGWSGPVLVLGSEVEAASPTLWPPGVDGLLLRPAP